VLRNTCPVYDFGYHANPDYLVKLERLVAPEPWGRDLRFLAAYLRARFEMAQMDGAVHESSERCQAAWNTRLFTAAGEEIWLVYRVNQRAVPCWQLDDIRRGKPGWVDPDGMPQSEVGVREFRHEWPILVDEAHIMREPDHFERIRQAIPCGCPSASDHVVFRAVCGEIEFERKTRQVIPQWYHGHYQFLMPLRLTAPDRVDLVAALMTDTDEARYIVKTVLPIEFAYAHARVLVKHPGDLPRWMQLQAN